MEKEIEIGGKKFKVRKLKLKEGLALQVGDDPKKATLEFVSKCLVEPKMSLEELEDLDFDEGIKLVNAVNELNGLTENFTKPKANSVTD